MKLFFLYLMLFTHSDYSLSKSKFDCKDQITRILKEYQAAIHNVAANKVVYLHYKVETKLRKNENKAGVQEVKAYIGKDKSKVINEYSEIYSNQEYTISVLPKDKILLVTQLPKNYNAEWKSKLSLSMLDSVFTYYTIGDCSKNKKGLTHISLIPSALAKKRFNVVSVEIDLNETQNKLKSVKMNMGSKGDIESMQMEYMSFHTDNISNVSFPALPNSFIKNGKPSKKYMGYQLIDKTKN